MFPNHELHFQAHDASIVVNMRGCLKAQSTADDTTVLWSLCFGSYKLRSGCKARESGTRARPQPIHVRPKSLFRLRRNRSKQHLENESCPH